MPAQRRKTFGLRGDASTLLSPVGLHNIFAAVLDALRDDTSRISVDLLPLSPRDPLPPAARQAAFALQHLTKSVGPYPFDGVEVNPQDDAQWGELMTVAPYAPHLVLQAGRWTDLFESSGDLDSVRLELLPAQVKRITAALTALSPEGLGTARLRAR